VKHFIGVKYYPGIGIVPILLLANLFLGIVFNLSIWYKLNNMTIYGAYITIFGALVTIAANCLLIPLMGYAGAAWATFVCYLLMMILSYLWGQRHFHVEYDLKKITEYFLLALSIYFVSKIWRFHSHYLPLIMNSILFIAFVGIAFYRENMLRLFVRKPV
jgi:O-antigen/teichoic acid export membrane protein